MTSIVITPKNKSELELISNLLKKLRIDASYLSDELKVDLGLKILMREVDRTKTATKVSIMKRLKT